MRKIYICILAMLLALSGTAYAEYRPIAEAGGPYTADEGHPVTLNASGSSDPDGDLLTYEWDLNGDGIYETSGMTPTIFPEDGYAEIIAGLLVSDGIDGASTDTATIIVNNLPPCKCEKITIMPRTNTQGKTITLDAVVTGTRIRVRHL